MDIKSFSNVFFSSINTIKDTVIKRFNNLTPLEKKVLAIAAVIFSVAILLSFAYKYSFKANKLDTTKKDQDLKIENNDPKIEIIEDEDPKIEIIEDGDKDLKINTQKSNEFETLLTNYKGKFFAVAYFEANDLSKENNLTPHHQLIKQIEEHLAKINTFIQENLIFASVIDKKLQSIFEEFLNSYQNVVEQAGKDTNFQNNIDVNWLKLKLFVEKHPQFTNQLPQKHIIETK